MVSDASYQHSNSYLIVNSKLDHNLEELRLGVEYLLKADLRKDVQKSLPILPLGIIDPSSMEDSEIAAHAQAVLSILNSALVSDDVDMLASVFYAKQAFWRDIAALTSHWRTFSSPGVIAAAFVKMKAARHIEGMLEIVGDSHLVVVSPVLVSENWRLYQIVI